MGRRQEPVMSCVADGTVTGNPLTLPLVKGVESVWVLSTLPFPGTQVPSLFKLIPEVIPVHIRTLHTQTVNPVRTEGLEQDRSFPLLISQPHQ